MPRGNAGALAPAGAMLAEVGNVLDARRVRQETPDGRCLEEKARGRIFQGHQHARSNSQRDKPNRDAHLLVTAAKLFLIEWPKICQAVKARR